MQNHSHLLASLRVLIAEDDSIVSMLLEDYVDGPGCDNFRMVDTETDALELLSTYGPDFAIVDLTLREND